MLRRALLLAAVALGTSASASGCGSAPDARLPPAATALPSPPLTAAPAGRVTAGPAPAPRRPGGFRLDRGAGALVAPDGRRARTGLDPVDVALAEDGRVVAVLTARSRDLELYDARSLAPLARADAGIGPARLASNGRQRLYVTDAPMSALLTFRTRPRLLLVRRDAVPGGAFAIAYDPGRDRLWLTRTQVNVVSEFKAGYLPGPIRDFPAVRAPRAVVVEPGGGPVVVSGQGVQRLVPPPLPARRTP